MKSVIDLTAMMVVAAPVFAQSAYVPKKGSVERTAILDTIRASAEEHLGQPLEFVVHDLKAHGDKAYASLMAQRPGGKKIDMASTPDARKYGYDPERYPGIDALLERKVGAWSVTALVISATDVPFYGQPYCGTWAQVLPKDWCQAN